jgi:outer membrane protein OmpA-like peptidoglycan-associated protein
MNRFMVMATLASIVMAGCATPGKRTAVGTGAGAAAGAGVGAIIGHQSGNKGKGAAIGAAAGAAIGGMIGNRLDKQAKELAQVAETKRTEDGIITKLKNDLLFDFGSADLRPQARENIVQISNILKQYPENRISIVGYTDNKGTDLYNQQLSERRARTVKLEMVSNGVPAASVEALGQGETNPIAPNDTEDGRSKNRRVELQITADPSKVQG